MSSMCSGRGAAHRAVVRRSTCPSRAETVCTGTPASRQWVAQQARSESKETQQTHRLQRGKQEWWRQDDDDDFQGVLQDPPPFLLRYRDHDDRFDEEGDPDGVVENDSQGLQWLARPGVLDDDRLGSLARQPRAWASRTAWRFVGSEHPSEAFLRQAQRRNLVAAANRADLCGPLFGKLPPSRKVPPARYLRAVCNDCHMRRRDVV
jgi:hypothetical protein